jgi:hypothetical protein
MGHETVKVWTNSRRWFFKPKLHTASEIGSEWCRDVIAYGKRLPIKPLKQKMISRRNCPLSRTIWDWFHPEDIRPGCKINVTLGKKYLALTVPY